MKEDLKIKAGEGSQRVRKGYIGHIVQICRKLQEYSAANNEIKKFVDSNILLMQATSSISFWRTS